jgi:D-alanyl-D-alanine carboxypeptidase
MRAIPGQYPNKVDPLPPSAGIERAVLKPVERKDVAFCFANCIEGSGISRDNRFTARGLVKVLELFAPHADLLHGHDGGMNKTGTMDGIRTLAGYADTSRHGRVRFVISLTSDDETRFRLLRAIESEL